jgi:hypothetical protein
VQIAINETAVTVRLKVIAVPTNREVVFGDVGASLWGVDTCGQWLHISSG